jgi:hypothetical protein
LYRKGHADALLGVCETTVEKLLGACISDETDEPSEEDLILCKLNKEGKEVGTVRVIKAQLLSANDASVPIEPTNVRNGSDLSESFSSAACEILLPPLIQDTPRQSRPRFKEYVDSGCEIDLCYAVDFTSSNGTSCNNDCGGTLRACLTFLLSVRLGDPRIPGTLHYQAADSLNDYEEAITSIGDALSCFNSTKEYPVWGFGAKFGGITRHIFQCGLTSPVQGVDGVLEAYRSVFHSDLLMSGPTHFGHVIQAAAWRARKYHESMSMCRRYCVLLIITDGMVDDVEETQRKLRVYKNLPLSVIILGVGRAEFKGLNTLCNQGTPARFVEFRKHQHNPSSMAKAALEELPRQIVDYMTANTM